MQNLILYTTRTHIDRK